MIRGAASEKVAVSRITAARAVAAGRLLARSNAAAAPENESGLLVAEQP